MSIDLWGNINYKTPAKYFINTYIREYDLSKANINALLYCGRISKKEYDAYTSCDKRTREVQIGLLIKHDKSIYRDIQNGIIEAKKKLILSNGLDESRIVSIKNDAVFVNGEILKYREFSPFTFTIKNTYTIFLSLQNLEVYYSDNLNQSTGQIDTNIDIKGIPDKTLIFHSDGMLDLICDLCYRLQRERIEETMKWICCIYESFIKRQLPKQYYRNFDSFSQYIINTYVHYVSMDDINDDMIDAVDINRNLSLLRDMISIVSSIYRVQCK